MIPDESNLLVPNATFLVELVLLIGVVATLVWLLVRYLIRGSSTQAPGLPTKW